MNKIIVKFSFAIALVVIVAVSPFAHSHFSEMLDNIIDCSEEAEPQLLLIIFDISDPYDSRDINYVMQDLDSIFKKTNKSTRFHILQMTEDERNSPIPIFASSIIPNVNRMPFYLKIVASDDIKNDINERNKKTLKLVNQYAEQILKSKKLNTSPIIESLINITKSYEFQSSKDIKIILYSDMRQNTKTLSMLRYNKSNSKIDLTKLNYSKISLKDAVVEVRYIKRSSLEDGKFEQQIRQFWNSWFQYSDAKIQWR